MFVGRESEIKTLTEHYLSDNFAFIPIYGRRRVGKTKLIEEFVKGKKVIFFTAIEGVYSQNLELLSQSIFGSPSAPVFNDFSAALEHIYTIAAKEKIVFVIDEYPYLAQSERSVSSILQHAIDHKFLSTNMLLILSGSSMSFMENQVLGYQSPLYGRRSGQIKLLPESFENSRSYAPLFTAQEQAIMYGVTGGVPKYLSLFNDKNTLDNNMLMQFFNKDSFLYEETDNLLKQELSEPAFYKAII
ncbi:MAG: ATP-binding protein, partial [Oscillospiraceae bacterium]|nr:ATP-binding protein [Oscillospiraceae bacterium]